MENLYVCFKETGDKIVNVDSVKEGRNIIKYYKHLDFLDGTLEIDRYMICELANNDLDVVNVLYVE